MIFGSTVSSKLIISLSFLAGFIVPGIGQISSPKRDLQGFIIHADTITGTDTVIIDTLQIDQFFIYHSTNTNPLSLHAEDFGNTADFYWYRFDSTAWDFSLFDSTNLKKSSTLSDIEPGGYRVRISGESGDTVFSAWIFRNAPEVRILDDDGDGKVDIYQYICDYLVLKGVARADIQRYYDFSDGVMRSLSNVMSFEWTCDDSEYEIFGATKYLNLYIYNNPPSSRPPTKDTQFTLTGTDSYNLKIEDDILYESIHVKADFSMMIEDEEAAGTWTEAESPEGEAPLEVKFVNLSENGEEFRWTFIDSAKTGSVEMDTTYSITDTTSFKYYIPNYYFPSMVAMSSAGCLDSIKMTNPVYVKPSELDIPNVFSPDKDGTNDFFMVSAKSLKEFKITIFNRWGNLIYEHVQTEDKFEWEGWDGTLYGKGNVECASGVYFYVIEAIGWDKEKYRGGIYRGFVYLFRGTE